MPRLSWIVLLLPVLACSQGCITSRITGARTQFSQDATCPEDRVAVRETPLVLTPVEPPPDVAADPQRLAMWQARDAEQRRAKQSDRYYVVSGCGASHVYRCYYCVEMPGETDCGMAPNCDEQASCRESTRNPGYVTCDGS